MGTRKLAAVAVTMIVSATMGVAAAGAAGTVGTSFPAGFPAIVDAARIADATDRSLRTV